jgi:cell division protease FtsH
MNTGWWRAWQLHRRRRRLASARSGRSRRGTLALTASLAVLLVAVVGSFAYLNRSAPGKEISLDELARLTRDHKVVAAELLDEDAQVVVTVAGARGHTAYPANDSTTGTLVSALTDAGARVTVDPQTAKRTVRVVLTVLLPLMILANLFALYFGVGRGGGSALGEVVSFGQLRRRRARGRTGGGAAPAVTFDDVAGLDEAVAELTEVVDYLKAPDRYRELGATAPKGVLLFGPPGCGKTLLGKAVAGAAEVPFFSVAGAEFVESLVGVGAARVRDLFARVRAVAPAIVFIDELDAAGRRRSSGGGGSEERDQTLNQLLVEMDGFDVDSGIVVMAATNRPDILDPALLRPGRFDRHITIERPDLERRRAILELHAGRRPVLPDVDLGLVARLTAGFSGAELASVVNEAALLTIRAGRRKITAEAVSEAVQRVLSGPQRRMHLLSVEERRRIACHEAGHAVVAAALGHEVHRVSVLARNRLLGDTRIDGGDDELATRSALFGRIVAVMGGTAAEELVLGQPSTGSEDDLARATELALDLLGRYGMGEALGRLRLLDGTATGEAWTMTSRGWTPAPDTWARLDAELRQTVDRAFADATALLETRAELLATLTDRLLEREILEGTELAAVLGGAPSTGRPKLLS